MEMVFVILFWLAIGWVFYANFGYLLLLWIVQHWSSKPVRQAEITPSVSLLIAAHNEERVIAEKLENSLALDYPADKLEIIVMSDASTDRTDEIVRSFAGRGVRLNAILLAGGKPNAMNLTVPITRGEILVVSDADSHYAPDALRKLVRNFADPQVGAVTGAEQRVANCSGEGSGEGLYCRLDNHIKRLEGEIGSMVMVNGGFVAIRRCLYPEVDPNLNFDLVWAPLLQLQGYRTAYEPQALSTEVYPLDAGSDFRRRLRTVLQAFYSYLAVPAALNPFKTGWYAMRLISHRFTRWFVLPFLALALFSSAWLAFSGLVFYQGALLVQLVCYALALGGWLLERSGRRPKPFYLPFYFIYIHLAAFIAVVQAMQGKRLARWTPTQRDAAAVAAD